jgi:glutamate-1-semialdehyde 2,1-aminomutase
VQILSLPILPKKRQSYLRNPDDRSDPLKRSKALFARAQERIPGGVNSPVRAFRSVGGEPRFIKSGKGSHIVDVDGNKYIDYLGSWGPLILGHSPSLVQEALRKQILLGTSFGAPTEN